VLPDSTPRPTPAERLPKGRRAIGPSVLCGRALRPIISTGIKFRATDPVLLTA
jgi:hypothetical protein